MEEVEKMAINLFISHSVSDEKLARALISLLSATFYLKDWEVRCTSLEGYDTFDEALATGRLSQELRQAKLVIFIITPFSDESGWLRLELALAWGSYGDSVLLLPAGLYFKNLPEEFPEDRVVDVSDKDNIYEMMDQIGKVFRWEQKPETGKIGAAVRNLVTVSKSYKTLEYEATEEDKDEDDE